MLIRTYPAVTIRDVLYNGRAIARARARLHISSQEKLAKQLGLNKETVGRIEKGDTAVSVANLGSVLQALGLSFVEVFAGTDLRRHGTDVNDPPEVTLNAPASSGLVETSAATVAFLVAEIDAAQERLISAVERAETAIADSKAHHVAGTPPHRRRGGGKTG